MLVKVNSRGLLTRTKHGKSPKKTGNLTLDEVSGIGYNAGLKITQSSPSILHDTMYAIIADGAHQYKVEPGQVLDIDLREVNEGDMITFDRVLALSTDKGFKLGQPTIAGAKISGKVVNELVKGEKLVVSKFRRRKNSKRRTGHRQKYVRVEIQDFA
jgi:large subunit ribosomal protein L21